MTDIATLFFGGKKPSYTSATPSPKEVVNKPYIGKPVEEVVACVVDYGTFICLADKLGETYKKVYYFTPTSQEFYSIEDLVKAEGLPNVERVNDIFGILDEIDLFIFPDIGYGGLQRYLRSIGKAVWGSMGADEIEVVRTEFLATLKRLGLPVIHTETIKGLAKLREHLRDKKDKYIKVDHFRGNMETWHHIDYDHSAHELDKLAIGFGGLQDEITFVVQDHIKTDVEIGYDGWCIDGEFPSANYQGYEKKDQLYLGSLLKLEDLPKQVKQVNEAMAPLLKEYQYRNFFATEIRVKDGIPYFIDPTLRMPGITGEQLLETCSNLPEVIWRGAKGDLIEPEFEYEFAAAAVLHCNDDQDGWKVLKVPKRVEQWVKLLHYCKLGDCYHFPKRFNDELGLVLGCGNSIEEAIETLKEHVDMLKGQPVHCELDEFADLMHEIEEAKKYGIEFTDREVPSGEDILAIVKS